MHHRLLPKIRLLISINFLFIFSACGASLNLPLSHPPPLTITFSCQVSQTKTLTAEELELIQLLNNQDLNALEDYLNKNPKLIENTENSVHPIHIAAYFGNIQALKWLLDRGVSANLMTCKKNTALHYAAFALQPEAIDLLLSRGASPKNANSNGDTPLHFASGVPIELLYLGQNSPRFLTLISLPESLFSKLHLSRELSTFKQAKKQVIQSLLQKGAEIEAKNKDEQTPLFYAATSKEVDAFRQLVQAGANLFTKDSHQENLMHQLALGPLPLEAMLSSSEKDEKIWHQAKTYDSSSVRLQPLLELIQELIGKGFPFDAVGDFGFRPIHNAARTGQEEIIALLLRAGAQVNSPKDLSDPLSQAASIGDLASAKRLLDAGALLNYTRSLSTAAASAAGEGQLDMLKFLIDQGALIECKGVSALTSAVHSHQLEVVDYLLSVNADLNYVDLSGDSPLVAAIKIQNEALVKKLIAAGANTDALDRNGNLAWVHLIDRPLYFQQNESNQKKLDKATFLRNFGQKIDLGKPNKEGNTLLHYWIEPYQTIFLAPENLPQNLNLPNHLGQTPLHLAVMAGNLEWTKTLIEKGADLEFEDKAGKSSIDLALSLGNLGMVQYFATLPGQSLAFREHTSAYLEALTKLDLPILQLLIKQADWNPNYYDDHGKGLLGYLTDKFAFKDKKFLDTLALLLSAGVSPDQYLKPVGETALILFAKTEATEAVQMLLDRGANPNLVSTQNQGNTARTSALHLAAEAGNEALVLLLLKKGADPSLIDGHGNTALHILATKGLLKALQEASAQGYSLHVLDWQDQGLLSACFNIPFKNEQLITANWLLQQLTHEEILNDLKKESHYSEMMKQFFKLHPELEAEILANKGLNS